LGTADTDSLLVETEAVLVEAWELGSEVPLSPS